MDIYWIIYYLDPNHQPITMTSTSQSKIFRYILKFLIGNLEKHKLYISFFIFKQQNKLFDITNKIYTKKIKFLLFWQMAFIITSKYILIILFIINYNIYLSKLYLP